MTPPPATLGFPWDNLELVPPKILAIFFSIRNPTPLTVMNLYVADPAYHPKG